MILVKDEDTLKKKKINPWHEPGVKEPVERSQSFRILTPSLSAAVANAKTDVIFSPLLTHPLKSAQPRRKFQKLFWFL